MFVAWKTPIRPGVESRPSSRTTSKPPTGRGRHLLLIPPSRRRQFPAGCFAVIIFLFIAACQQPARQTPTRDAPPPQAPATSAPTAQTDKPPAKPTPPDAPLPPRQQRPARPPAEPQSKQPEPTPPTPSKDDEQEARRLAEIARLLAEAQPKRPTTPPWVVLREVFDETADATCSADWTGENRLEIHTENIKRLTLDLSRLPSGAPQRGPWNLQLDTQGIQITGLHGRVLDLVRSKAGNWTVDRSRFKK